MRDFYLQRLLKQSLKPKASMFYQALRNSLVIHEESTKKTTTMSVVFYSVIKFHVNLHNLDKVDFERYFANELIG